MNRDTLIKVRIEIHDGAFRFDPNVQPLVGPQRSDHEITATGAYCNTHKIDIVGLKKISHRHVGRARP